MTVTTVAARRDVTRRQIYSWRSLRRKGLLGSPPAPEVAFLPVGSIEALAASPMVGPAPAMIEIAVACGRVLKAPASTPTAELKRLIRAVERA